MATGKPGKIKGLLITVIALCVTTFKPGETLSADKLKIYKNRKLEAVTLSEIGLAGSGVSAPLNPFETDVAWSSSSVETPELLLEQVYNTTKITRRNVLLWYYQYDTGGDEDNGDDEDDEDEDDGSSGGTAYNVEYRILSRSGIENALSHKNDKSSIIRAHITKKPVECQKKKKNRIRCLGRVDLDLDISQARRSGKYHGTIEITITTL